MNHLLPALPLEDIVMNKNSFKIMCVPQNLFPPYV